MCLVDANIVLRYILNDHPILSVQASEIIDNNRVIMVVEVLCEIVYVLQKVYSVPKIEIASIICELIDSSIILSEKEDVIKKALTIYATRNIDIVDAILCAYHSVENKKIYTFDDKLNKYLNVKK